MNDRNLMDNVYQTFRGNPGCEKAAKEAFMSFAADILMCGGDWQKTQECVGNALYLSCGHDEVRAYANKERILVAFPFLREGDAA